jgi:hypothetical protein
LARLTEEPRFGRNRIEEYSAQFPHLEASIVECVQLALMDLPDLRSTFQGAMV